jgi:predicted Zn finger-like uncharacterized protein
MKFHCDRCKTRYSIADERVRGKILKIRCKNCSAVITVKESGSNTSVELTGKPAAAGAPAATSRPAVPKPASPAASAPVRPATPLPGGAAPGAALAAKRAQAPAIPAAARAPGPARAPSVAAARQPAVAARPAGNALQGAFAKALKRSPADAPASESMSDAPAVLEAEWYVSLDGEQFGPYPLRQAQEWVG